MPSRIMLLAIGIALACVNTVRSSNSGCLVGGTWLAEGASAAGGEACLRCTCRGGALACARRACGAAPEPPPPRCHTLHRKGACCPELHCPNSITTLELGASARFETDDFSDMSGTHGSVCIDGGTAYSAGSAMKSHMACEQCFCLRGARRCVRPTCLAPPRGCRARPSAGACCPQRYYCDHVLTPTSTPSGDITNDCLVNGIRIPEGEPVPLAERQHNCTQCFCLRGLIKCQHLACAPPLLGCTPILRPGECCPHKYHCHHDKHNELAAEIPSYKRNNEVNSPNSLSFQSNDDRSPKGKSENNTPIQLTNLNNKVMDDRIYSTTNKVKRKTNDESTNSNKGSQYPHKFARFREASTTENDVSTTDYDLNTELNTDKETTTDEPETMVKILINGTINCTTTLSSFDPLDVMDKENYNRNQNESLPRVPSIDRMDDDFNPEDLITDQYVSGAFDDNDSFTVNVTSSLRANSSHPIKGSVISIPKVGLPADLIGSKNESKKKKEDYDYDYTEPTLPPSLPNLKIIPFVAADAVVDEEKSSDPATFPLLEREDKHPIYYPQADKSQHATRREDVYSPSQYPVYTSHKLDSQYNSMPQLGLPGVSDLAASLHEYAVSATLGNRPKGPDKGVTVLPTSSLSLNAEAPEDNLFSPPVETEGGFVPKGPGLINEYYAVYPSTAVPLHAPHLTTSMQLDPSREDCVSSDGRRVAEGDSVSMKCSICACAWGELHCSPRPCLTPPGCERRPPTKDSKDICCGDISCGKDKRVSSTSSTTTSTEPPLASSSEDSSEMFEDDYEEEENEENYLPDITTAEFDNITDTTKAPEMSSPTIENITTKQGVTKQEPVMSDRSENNTVTNQSVANMTEKLATIANIALANQNSSATLNTSRIHQLGDFLIRQNETVKPTVKTKIEETYETETNEPQTHDAQDYEEEEEEEDDDEGFSFGSVLKLLLSETYDSTPKPQDRKTTPYITTTKQVVSSTPSSTTTSTSTSTTTTTTTTTTPKPVSTTRKYIPSTIKTITTTRKVFTKPTVAPFKPMPQHQLYAPPKNYFAPTSVNKIDHLVLGEATAIRKTSSKPSTMNRPIISTLRPVTLPPTIRSTTTKKPVTYQNSLEITQSSDKYTSTVQEGPRPTSVTQGAMPGPGLLKLAGCNIYGKMYRVGRIIAELSSACQECRCTEIGVQCRDLSC